MRRRSCAADETEEEVIDVKTTKGYEQIVDVWEARDDVDAVLGRRAWKTFFLTMSKGRLRPTPWLNKVRLPPHSTVLLDTPLFCLKNLSSSQRDTGLLHLTVLSKSHVEPDSQLLLLSKASKQKTRCFAPFNLLPNPNFRLAEAQGIGFYISVIHESLMSALRDEF